MPCKLYIGNLPMDFSEAELENALRDTCADFGQVEDLFIIKDKNTGDHRGFGFVTFAAEDAAELALQLNGKKIFLDAPKPLRVVWARDRSERPLHAQTSLGCYQPAPWEQQERLPWQ
jgi:cold-inducible RNA-binding protein